jgi:hypothetical protein
MLRSAPELLPESDAATAYADEVLAVLLGPPIV